MDGLHLQPSRLETLPIPGDHAPGDVLVVFVTGGGLESHDHRRVPSFGSAEAVVAGGVTERTGEIRVVVFVTIVVLVVPVITFEFEGGHNPQWFQPEAFVNVLLQVVQEENDHQ